MDKTFRDLSGGSSNDRLRAAITIGHEHPEQGSAALLEQLTHERDVTVAAACCAALELIHDTSTVKPLLAILKKCPDDQVWDIAHTLGQLTGTDPLIPLGAEVSVLRKRWLEALQSNAKPMVSTTTACSEFLRFTVDNGTGKLRFDYDMPPSGTVSWPRWGRSLLVGDRALYSVGSTCGTCETMLSLVGWSEQRAFRIARRLSASMQDRVDLSPSWIKLWSPILGELQTGHYLGTSLDLPIEQVSSPDESWMTLRQSLRSCDEVDDGPQETDRNWPGCVHFQGPTFSGERRSYWVVLPSQDLSTLKEDRVSHYARQIEQGKSPSILALGWMEDRSVQAEWNERFVILCILDGHHKLQAYARCYKSANIIALFHLENTWGPRTDPSIPLTSAILQLQRDEGQMSGEFLPS